MLARSHFCTESGRPPSGLPIPSLLNPPENQNRTQRPQPRHSFRPIAASRTAPQAAGELRGSRATARESQFPPSRESQPALSALITHHCAPPGYRDGSRGSFHSNVPAIRNPATPREQTMPLHSKLQFSSRSAPEQFCFGSRPFAAIIVPLGRDRSRRAPRGQREL
jgi:hypothetical protein